MIKEHVRPTLHDVHPARDESVISLLPPAQTGLQKGGGTREDGTSASSEVAELSLIARFTASPWFPHIVLLCCQLSFASMHITSHSALDYLPPTVYATFRIGMAVPLLFLSAGVQEPSFRTEWGDVPVFIGLGLLGVAIPQTLVYVGNKLAGAAFVGVFTPTVPVYVAILSAILRIERFTLLKGVGIVFAILGAFVLVHVDKLDLHTANTKGILALIGLQASFAVYLVALQRYLARRPFPFSFFARASTCGAAAVAATAVARGDFANVAWGGVPASAWAALAWAGLGTSFAAHSAVSWAVGRCSAVVPSIYSCMQPVLTTSLAAAFLGQTLTGRDLAAVGAILAGVLCVIYSKVSEDSRRRRETAAEYQLVGLPIKGQNHDDGGHALPVDGSDSASGSCSSSESGGSCESVADSSGRQRVADVRLDMPHGQR